jgi:hypothetical protein
MEIISRRTLAVAVAVALACSSSTAFAERHRSFGGGGFASNGVFGLGLELGEPSGLNGKYFYAPDKAIDFGIGWIYGNHGYYDGFHIYADHLWHPVTLVRAEAFQMPFFIGVGGRLWSFCDACDNRSNATAIGVRVPFGISFDFNNVPLDVFVQLAVVADLFVNYPGHSFGPGIDGSLGIRFWFD